MLEAGATKATKSVEAVSLDETKPLESCAIPDVPIAMDSSIVAFMDRQLMICGG